MHGKLWNSLELSYWPSLKFTCRTISKWIYTGDKYQDYTYINPQNRSVGMEEKKEEPGEEKARKKAKEEI